MALQNHTKYFHMQSPAPAALLPELFGCKHLIIIHDLALVVRDLESGQNIVDPREACPSTGSWAVHFPLQDIKARPASHMGALKNDRWGERESED